MKAYIAPGWGPVVLHNGLKQFDTLWNLSFNPLDEPNRRGDRESFSVVGRVDLRLPEGGWVRMVMKRQQNYTTRTFLHPISGIPTFEFELTNIIKYQEKGLPVLSPVLFAKNSECGQLQAVLISEYLQGYEPLSVIIESRNEAGKPDREAFLRILKAVACVVRRVHDFGYQYGCLYPKHIFVREAPDRVSVKLIDLEKSRYHPFGRRRIYKDLETLYRHGGFKTGQTDLLRFVLAYAGAQRTTADVKTICRSVESRYRKKLDMRSRMRSADL
jgi:hypothetical protein